MVQTTQREQSEQFSKAEYFAKSAAKSWFAIGKVMVRCIFYCKFCHVSISEKDLWNGINKELHQRLEEYKHLKKLMQKNSGKSNLETKKVALNREIEQALGNIVRLESQKRSGYERYVLGKLSKEKFLELKQSLENEIVVLKQKKSEREKNRLLFKRNCGRKSGLQAIQMFF